MIAHHTGGVAMAQAAVAEARTPEVRTLAGAIAAAQTSEIAAAAADARRALLNDRRLSRPSPHGAG